MRKYSKVIIVTVLLAVLAVVATRAWLVRDYKKVEISNSLDSLNIFQLLRLAALEDFFGSVEQDVKSTADSNTLRTAFADLKLGWDQLPKPQQRLRELYIEKNPNPIGERNLLANAGDGSDYSRAHEFAMQWANRFIEHFGYYDVFLIDNEGNIIFSQAKEADFASNLTNGEYSGSALATAFRSALNRKDGKSAFTDFEPYPPSNNEPAAFAAYGMRNAQGEKIGAFAIQIPRSSIERLLEERLGLGKTGETYLVGADHLMRSQSRFAKETTMLRQRVDTWPLRRAMAGQTGSIIANDYRDRPVLSAYSPFDIGDTRWALLAEMDESEVLSRIDYRRINIWAVLAGLTVLTFGWIYGGFYSNRLQKGWGTQFSFADIRRVESSWQKITTQSDEFGIRLYSHLLKREPQVGQLFSLPPEQQGPLFTQMLGAAVTRLQSRDEAQSMLRELGRRHVGYGVSVEHFKPVKVALMETLAETLGKGFTPAMQTSWDRACDAITASMIEGLTEGD